VVSDAVVEAVCLIAVLVLVVVVVHAVFNQQQIGEVARQRTARREEVGSRW
jgi:heme exporter protein D